MTSIRNTIEHTVASANETVLEFITGLPTRIVDANAQLAAAIAGRTPDLPAWVPTANLPQASNPRQLVERGFAFQAKLLEATRSFSVGLLGAWTGSAAPEAPKRTRK
jgi:hypothetical protein